MGAACKVQDMEASEASLSSKGIRKRRKGHTFSGVKRLTARLPECMQIERESFRLRKVLSALQKTCDLCGNAN